MQPSDMMELYLDLHSQPCRSVFLFAKLAGIPFEFKHVDLTAGKSAPLSPRDRRVGHVASGLADWCMFAGF